MAALQGKRSLHFAEDEDVFGTTLSYYNSCCKSSGYQGFGFVSF